ncbi:MAG: VOC family protein, partial [Anaerolineales bacterium]
ILAVRGREQWLGVADTPLLVLHGDPKLSTKPRRATGLYHFALLHPDRAALGRSLRRLLDAEVALQGGADHLVSEAIYLADPEGNGIELYRDRPRDEWPYLDGELQMATDPLDWDGVLAAASGEAGRTMSEGTVMGHVHLHVAQLQEAERFYGEVLCFDRVLRYGRAATFYSVDGYHHHIGFNTWAGERAPAPPEGSAGLDHFTLLLPSAQALGSLSDRLKDKGVDHLTEPGALVAADPSGNQVRIALAQNNRAPGGD